MHDDHDEALRRLAARQGVAVRRWAGTDGHPTAAALRGRVRRGLLRPALCGVYVPRGLPAGVEAAWLLALLGDRTGRAVLTGEVACHLAGLSRARREAAPLVLVPHGSAGARLPAGQEVPAVRTRRLPRPLLAADPCGTGAWPVAPLARALADAVVRAPLDHARALVGDALSSGLVRQRALVHEVTAHRRRSPVRDAVLADLAAGGVWSVPEGALLDLVATSCVLPRPRANALLVDPSGRPVLRPDALWEAAALAASVDSRQHHGGTAAWSQTLLRAAEAEACGLLCEHLTPEVIARRGHQTLLGLERHWCARLGTASLQGLRVLDGAPPRRRPAA